MHMRKLPVTNQLEYMILFCVTRQSSTMAVDSCGITSSLQLALQKCGMGNLPVDRIQAGVFGCSCCSMREVSRDKSWSRSIQRKSLQWVGQMVELLQDQKVRKIGKFCGFNPQSRHRMKKKMGNFSKLCPQKSGFTHWSWSAGLGGSSVWSSCLAPWHWSQGLKRWCQDEIKATRTRLIAHGSCYAV